MRAHARGVRTGAYVRARPHAEAAAPTPCTPVLCSSSADRAAASLRGEIGRLNSGSPLNQYASSSLSAFLRAVASAFSMAALICTLALVLFARGAVEQCDDQKEGQGQVKHGTCGLPALHLPEMAAAALHRRRAARTAPVLPWALPTSACCRNAACRATVTTPDPHTASRFPTRCARLPAASKGHACCCARTPRPQFLFPCT